MGGTIFSVTYVTYGHHESLVNKEHYFLSKADFSVQFMN